VLSIKQPFLIVLVPDGTSRSQLVAKTDDSIGNCDYLDRAVQLTEMQLITVYFCLYAY
jgi:hypothetical protein